ncbi:MAG: FtsX-like permease family protein [Evtepia sp.]|nr:FtsX-like permease family protein [Evtepia sp.]
MKLLRLSFSRICGYWHNHRLTFLLFFLGAMASSFVFLYFYGNSMNQTIAIEEDDLAYHAFEVWFDGNTPVTEEQLRCLDHYGMADVQITSKAELPPELVAKTPDQAPIEVSTARENGEKLNYPIFSSEQLEQGGVLADKVYGTDLSSITINGIQFPVVGTVDHGAGVLFLPFDTYMKHVGQAHYILFLSTDILSRREIKQALNDLEMAFPTMDGCQGPDANMDADRESQSRDLVDTCILYVVSLLSFLFLFKYLQDQSREEAITYRLVGISQPKLFALILSEVGVLSLVACFLTCVIHMAFYPSFFSKLNMTETWIPYTAIDYLIVLGSTVLLALLTSLPFILTCLRDTPIGLRNRYSV